MWICYEFRPKNKKMKWKRLGEIDLPANCFGDELYDHMVEMGWVDTMENYDVSGDSEYVSVKGHLVKDGEFKWVFEPNDAQGNRPMAV